MVNTEERQQNVLLLWINMNCWLFRILLRREMFKWNLNRTFTLIMLTNNDENVCRL